MQDRIHSIFSFESQLFRSYNMITSMSSRYQTTCLRDTKRYSSREAVRADKFIHPLKIYTETELEIKHVSRKTVNRISNWVLQWFLFQMQHIEDCNWFNGVKGRLFRCFCVSFVINTWRLSVAQRGLLRDHTGPRKEGTNENCIKWSQF